MTPKLPEIWLQYSFDDLQSARALLREAIYNMVCFHSQQAVEKLFKSFIATYNQEIPRIHNLIRLHRSCEDLHGSQLNLEGEGLIFLNDVYIESRYPADFGILPSGQPDKEEARKAYDYAKDMDAILRPLVRERITQYSNKGQV
jgi:HEPN domain-containing protein